MSEEAMQDDIGDPSLATEPVVVGLDVPRAPTPQPALPEAPISAQSSAPVYPSTDIGLRQWFRSNIEWCIKETDLHAQGATPVRREKENSVNPNP